MGEGAALALPEPDEYREFLRRYHAAMLDSPVLGLKDNLLNIVRHQEGRRLFRGCTGYGCGAAFNFFAVLPNGEAHACRKFPSPIGNLLEQSFSEVYASEAAQAYRRGNHRAWDGPDYQHFVATKRHDLGL